MSRRYEAVVERAEQALTEAKSALKALPSPERAHVLRWLLTYYEDDGQMKSPQIGRPRRRVVIDGTEFWLVKVPKKRRP